MDNQKIRPNYTKLTILIILLFATALTAYFWYNAENWSNIIQSGNGWYSHPLESRQSIDFEYAVAFQRISIIWLVSAGWSVYLGLRNKIKPSL